MRKILANYSMSPYGIWAAPRYARQGERKLIDDLDGKGAELRTTINKVLDSLRADALTVDSLNPDRAYAVRTISKAPLFTYADVGVARRGVVGQLRKKGELIPIGASDWNETWLRVLVLFPPNSAQAYWLCERVHGVPIVSYFSTRFKNDGQADLSDAVTLHVDPVSNWEALTDWLEKVGVKELTFDAPRTPGAQQSVDVDGLRGDVRISVKPRASFPLKRVMKNARPDPEAVFGLLRGVPTLQDQPTERYIEQGWKASVSYNTPNGKQRSFGITTEAEAPTLIYTVGDEGALDRPTRQEFAAACLEFIDDMLPSDPSLTSVKSAIEGWGGEAQKAAMSDD